MNLERATGLILLAVPTVFLSGCATSALWDSGRFARFHEPNEPPKLRLLYSNQRKDVLVQYVEARDSDGALRQRAYWLQKNMLRIQQRRKPQFVSVKQASNLRVIPLLGSPESSALPSIGSQYAIASTNGGSFTLYSTNQTIGSFDLPVYEDGSGRVKQVLLTPFTVVADLTIIGGVIVYYSLPESWESLNEVVGSGPYYRSGSR